LLGIREFSLAALVERYFHIELRKGSQKANWAQRPLPRRMLEYAINDTHYLLPLAERLEKELQDLGRFDWFRQSCERAIDQAATERTRSPDDIWRISGSGALRGRAAAILRELWHWRELEAEATDRPPFHILQNHQLLRAADSFHTGTIPDYGHFSEHRRGRFRAAAERALQMEEAQWPRPPRRLGVRRTDEFNQRVEELRSSRDRIAVELNLDPAFLAPRAVLESIAADETQGSGLLVAWQRKVLGIGK
jgi:ribonuclease D